MRTSKKIVSLVLAVMMVVSMMSVMAISVSAVDITEVTLSGSQSYTITEGGTYKITGTTSAVNAVIIDTESPVVIQDSNFTKTGTSGTAASAIQITGTSGDITVKDSTINTALRGINMTNHAEVGAESDLKLTVIRSNIYCTGVSDLETMAYTAKDSRGINMLTANYDVVIEDSEIKGFKYSINEATFNSERQHSVTVTDSTINGWAILNSYAKGGTYYFEDCTFTTINKTASGQSNSFAAFVFASAASNNTLTIDNCTVDAIFPDDKPTGEPYQSLFLSQGTNCEYIVTGSDTEINIAEGKGWLVSFSAGGSETNTVTVEDGTFNCDVQTYTNSKLIIEDGTFNNDVWALNEVQINGGTFNGTVASYQEAGGSLIITDGTFNGEVGSTAENGGDIVISGGTFSSEVPEEYCDAAFVPEDNGDGTYGVKLSYFAEVNGTKYESLAAAISAAQDGDTVKLLNSVTEKVTISGKTLTLDLNGFNITSATKNQPITAIDGTKLTIVNSNTAKSENTPTQNAITGPSGNNNYGSLIAKGEGTTVDIYAGFYYGYNGNKTAIHAINGATITFYDCVVNAAEGIDDTTSGKEGKVFYSGLSNPTKPYDTAPGYIIVHGGTFSGRMSDSNWGNYVIDGGTFDRNEVVLNENPVDEFGNRVATASGSMPSLGNGTIEDAGWPVNGFVVVDNGDGTFGVEPGTPIAGKAYIEGYQAKISDAAVRIYTKVDRDFLEGCDEYGYVVASVSGKTQAGITNWGMLALGNGGKKISCKDTVNTIAGYGDEYVTLKVTGMEDDNQVVARFYVVIDGVTYYAKYDTYDGILATY